MSALLPAPDDYAVVRCDTCDGSLMYDPMQSQPTLTHHDDGSHTMSWGCLVEPPGGYPRPRLIEPD